MMCKLFLVICTLSYIAYADVDPVPGYDLQFVHAVIRIGDQTPSEKFFKAFGRVAKLVKEDFKPGFSKILPKGKKIMYNIGKDLAQRYQTLLKGNVENTQVLSLDFDAAKEGMLIALDGLKGKTFDSNKVFSNDEMEALYPKTLMDDIARMVDQTKCPAYFGELRADFKRDEGPLMEKYNEPLKKVISQFSIDHPFGLFLLYELIITYVNTNKKTPEWFDDATPTTLKELSTDVLNSEFSNDKLVKLSGGRYVQNFLEEVEKMKSGTYEPTGRKMTMTGGSGPFLQSILTAMAGKAGYEKPTLAKQYPESGATFLVQVYKKQAGGSYHLQVYYKNGVQAKYEKMTIKGCEDLCEFGKLKNLLKDTLMTKDQADKECFAVPSTTPKPQ